MRINDCAKWLWRASRGFRLSVVGCITTGTMHVGVSLFFVYVCKRLIDIATGTSDGDLRAYVGWLVFSLTAQLLLSVARSRMASRTEIRFRNNLHRRLFVHLMESRWEGRQSLHTGDVLNRLESDVTTVTEAMSRTVPAVVITAVQLVGALFFLSRLDLRLACVLVFIMPVALLFSKRYVQRMRHMSREIRELDSRIQSHMQENLQHRILIRTLEYTVQAVGRLTGLQSALYEKIMHRTDFAIFSRTMVQFGFMTGYVVALLWGVFGLRDGSVSFGMMTAFLQLVAQIQRPMVDLSRQVPAFIRVATSTERLAGLEAQSLEMQGAPLRLKPGSLTAIVGETGVGKSTLVKLILALSEPEEGSICFYNATTEFEASPLTRCNLSYVPQGNTLMSGTIRDNLLMGNPHADEDEMDAALYAAAADFVFALPDGLDTYCGEQGAGISEGQAQRIAIARGLLRPGGVLLLDEPSSSLDGETEQILLQRLSERLQDKTLLLITHRETIAQLCTSVVRMESKI